MLLAIDTSTRLASLALVDGSALLAELSWPAGREQTASLLGQIDHLLALGDRRVQDLGAVAVATGPGSFNALRVGMSTAKGLNFALGLPLVGVPTLDATAYPHGAPGLPVRAVLAAGRGRFVSAPYRVEADGPRRVDAYANTTLEELAALIAVPTVVCGALSLTEGATLAALVPTARVVSAALGTRRAGYLAELAWRRWQRGEVDDPVTLAPLYLHGPAGGGTGAPRAAARATERGADR